MINILMLEDVHEDALLAERELSKAGIQFNLTRVQTRSDYQAVLRHRRPDLILADFHLPAFSGTEALQIARIQCRNVPFIFVSGALGEELAVEMLKAGATDYVLKERLYRLGPAVTRAMEEKEERSRRRHAEYEKELFALLIKNSRDLVSIVTMQGEFVFLNDAGHRLLGMDCSPGRRCFFELLPNTENSELHGNILSVLQKNGEWEGEVDLSCGNDTTRTLCGRIWLVLSRNGETMIAVVLRDVTESRQLQREVLDASTREQRRLGRDLHDGLGQTLTGLLFKSKMLRQVITVDHASVTALDEFTELTSHAIQQCRALSHGLCPEDLHGPGFAAALEQLAFNVQKLFCLNCRWEVDDEIAFDNDHDAAQLYYVAREAVNNALKHANAESIEIILKRRGGRILLQITDDGNGFDAGTASRKGIGLRLMEYRARLLGGHLSILPAPQRGTRVLCSLKDTRLCAALNKEKMQAKVDGPRELDHAGGLPNIAVAT